MAQRDRVETVGDRVARRRAEMFVGRKAEHVALESLLEPGGERAVAYVHGPGGIGKTELLVQFARYCRANGWDVRWLDADETGPQPAAFEEALRAAGRDGACVLIVDAFEYARGLEGWLRRDLLPRMPANVRFVFAGRGALEPSWASDAGWRGALLRIELDGFSPGESCDYLERRGIAPGLHAGLVGATHGHPLALSLVGEVLAQDPAERPELCAQPDVVQGLLEQLLRDVPDETHRRALWCGALAMGLSEDLLRAMLPDADAAALFDWMRRLSFVRAGALGLAPHDVARSALRVDLKWRDPGLATTLVRKGLEHYFEQLEDPGQRRDRGAEIVRRISYMLRTLSRHLDDETGDQLYVSSASEADWPEIEDMLERHEGPAAVPLFRMWAGEDVSRLEVVRSRTGEVVGFTQGLWMERVSEAQAARDPGVAPLHTWLAEASALDAGPIFYARFWMGRDEYQSPGPASAVLIDALTETAIAHDLAFGCSTHPDARSFLEASQSQMEHWKACDFTLEGRSREVVGIDFRAHGGPVAALRKTLMDLVGGAVPSPGVERGIIDGQLPKVLRSLDRPDVLQESPLLSMRLLDERGASDEPRARAERLAAQVRSALAIFDRAPADETYRRIIERTYLGAPTKQLEAAADLHMAYGSYRRHHATALRRIADELWRLESGRTPEGGVR